MRQQWFVGPWSRALLSLLNKLWSLPLRMWPGRVTAEPGRLFSCRVCFLAALIYYPSYITLFCCLSVHSHDFTLKHTFNPRL